MNAAAERQGILPGMGVTDARALLPGLRCEPADADGEGRLLAAIADWCQRYTPLVAIDGDRTAGGGGLWLDVTGCTHLFGGEEAMLADLLARVRLQGLSAAAALAGTPGAAFALARFTPARGAALAGQAVPPGGEMEALASLPVAALRLDPATVGGLERLGLRRIADLAGLPRAGLAARFGEGVRLRIDQALGVVADPITPRRPPVPLCERLTLAEPVIEPEAVAAVLTQLLGRLCGTMERAGVGARRLELVAFRVDGTVGRLAIGTGRPLQRAESLLRLFGEQLPRLDAGFGIETMLLAAPLAEPVAPGQGRLAGLDETLRLAAGAAAGGRRMDDGRQTLAAEIVDLADRLALRLGGGRVLQLQAQPLRMPEAAAALRPFGQATGTEAAAGLPRLAPTVRHGRPLRLLARPERIEAVAVLPDRPPVMFRWRGRVLRVRLADGPERIAPEWWCRADSGAGVTALDDASADEGARDYYRVETVEGARYWVFRSLGRAVAASLPATAATTDGNAALCLQSAPAPAVGGGGRWFLHGVFA